MVKLNTMVLRTAMSKPRKKQGNLDFRHWVNCPAPTNVYFFHRARAHNSQLQLIPWLVEHQRSMGLVKAVRQRHRRNAARSLDIWASVLT